MKLIPDTTTLEISLTREQKARLESAASRAAQTIQMYFVRHAFSHPFLTEWSTDELHAGAKAFAAAVDAGRRPAPETPEFTVTITLTTDQLLELQLRAAEWALETEEYILRQGLGIDLRALTWGDEAENLEQAAFMQKHHSVFSSAR